MFRVVIPILFALGLSSVAAAEREYIDRIPNGSLNSCGNCHDGGSFKSDWKRFGWGSELADRDSDGDGFTNGEELQDPFGDWLRGEVDPGEERLVSNPSSDGSVPKVLGAPSDKKALCIRKLNAGLVSVAEASGAALRECVKLGSEGSVTPTLCADDIEDDPKVVKRAARLAKRDVQFCQLLRKPPPFGATDAEQVASAAIEEREALLGDLFGADPDTALRTNEEDADGARCQRALLGASDRCSNEVLEAFEQCKKLGLKARRIAGEEDLAACLDEALAGKRAKRCGVDGSKLAKALALRCSEPAMDLISLFPGCAESTPEGVVECVADRIRCRSCRAVDEADDLGLECDLFEDDEDDESCEG